MNEIVAVIAALVGSSGVASILAGGTQFRRTHRLRSQLIELDESKQLVVPESREHSALQASVATVALELSAYIMIKNDSRRLVLLGIMLTASVGTYFITAGLTGPGLLGPWVFFPFGAPQDTVMTYSGLIIFMTGYIALFLYLYLRLTARKRQRFITRILDEPEGAHPEAIVRWSHHENHHRPQRSERSADEAAVISDMQDAEIVRG